MPQEHFSMEQFESVFAKFRRQVKVDGRDSLHATLQNSEPKLLSGYLIQMKVANSIQEREVTSISAELLGHLRKSLNNYSIKLNIVKDETKSKNNFMSPKDQYNKLVEQNPSIKKLRDLLDLDLEH